MAIITLKIQADAIKKFPSFGVKTYGYLRELMMA
jgi:hypothetical protein